MDKFGQMKNKILVKLTESFGKQNKSEMRDIISTLKENKELVGLYMFYDDMENKYFEDINEAKEYVETISTMLREKSRTKPLHDGLVKLSALVENIEAPENKLFESSIDVLLAPDTIYNIDTKIFAKKALVEHLTKKKSVTNEEVNTVQIRNQNLLNAVLVSNFNALYENTMSDEEKEEFRKIMAISQEEITTKFQELKEEVLSNVDDVHKTQLEENEITKKLNEVRNTVTAMEVNRVNYYRLMGLNAGLI